MSDKLVVTVTATIMDGPVVRWYSSEAGYRHGAEIMSASRDGVRVNVYLHAVPADALADAQAAYRALDRHRHELELPGEVAVLATHRGSVLRGDLIRIEHTEEEASDEAVRAG